MNDLQDIEEIYKKALNDLKSAYDRKLNIRKLCWKTLKRRFLLECLLKMLR